MLIWMSTGLPFNTTFNQMKRPNNPDNNGLDNEDLKMNARPELPIARKKRCDFAGILYTHKLFIPVTGLPAPPRRRDTIHSRSHTIYNDYDLFYFRGESGSRDGCVAIKAPNMDWVTADCTDLKDFICEQTRCYYYNYGSIPVSSSQG